MTERFTFRCPQESLNGAECVTSFLYGVHCTTIHVGVVKEGGGILYEVVNFTVY